MIKVEHLTKEYVLRHKTGARYSSLRDELSNKVRGIFTRREEQTSEKFLALNDISFEVKQGERVGIIGRNGAGKSTLLKVLSRIVAPTSGRITIDGRVASLLEVGTGFHPELTGRENIFLNGSILGMSREEIRSKFDEIVAFSEVEKFLDTPVKRYSSGMYVRLAFSVAAHLEPEILIVDEVLAVGDAAFQSKCLGKMKDVSGEGRTVLFVSHNMGAIRSMCNQVLFLKNGGVVDFGPTEKVIPQYMGVLKDNSVNGIYCAVESLSSSGEWEIGSDIAIRIWWEKGRVQPGWQCDIAAYTLDGIKIFAIQSETVSSFESLNKELNGIEFIVRNPGFSSGDLRLDFGLSTAPKQPYFLVVENCMFLSPSDKNLPEYSREDVLIIPMVTCRAITV